jgi:cell division protein FtsL
MPTRHARVRRAFPSLAPALLVLAIEIIVVVLIVAWRHQERNLCHQLQATRVTSNQTLRQPFRQFALEAANTRQASAERDDRGHPVQRRIDIKAAANYRVHDLPPLEC